MELFAMLAARPGQAPGVFVGLTVLVAQQPPLLDGRVLRTDRGLQDGNLDHEVFHLVLKRSLVRHYAPMP